LLHIRAAGITAFDLFLPGKCLLAMELTKFSQFKDDSVLARLKMPLQRSPANSGGRSTERIAIRRAHHRNVDQVRVFGDSRPRMIT